MSEPTKVQILLGKLHRCGETVSQAYFHGPLHRTDENHRDIELLRQLRMVSPYIRDAFQLRGSFRQFLNTALNTERLFAIGANVGDHFNKLVKLIDEHAFAFHEARDAAREHLEVEIQETISDIADAIEDELDVLHAQIATRFGAVSTIAEKRRQNLHYQERTQRLVDLLESLHFAEFADQLAGNDDLALAFRALLEDRIPAFRESLIAILRQLHQYLFEFRKIEERSKRLRDMALHLSRRQDWVPGNWDESPKPPEWLCVAKPLEMLTHPNVAIVEHEPLLREIALTIQASTGLRTINRPPGVADDGSDEVPEVVIETPAVNKALAKYFAEAEKRPDGLSARIWWLENPSLLLDIRQDLWIMAVLGEFDRREKEKRWQLKLEDEADPHFDGNVIISDILLGPKDA